MDLFQCYQLSRLAIAAFKNLGSICQPETRRSVTGGTYRCICPLAELFKLLERAWVPLPIHDVLLVTMTQGVQCRVGCRWSR